MVEGAGFEPAKPFRRQIYSLLRLTRLRYPSEKVPSRPGTQTAGDPFGRGSEWNPKPRTSGRDDNRGDAMRLADRTGVPQGEHTAIVPP